MGGCRQGARAGRRRRSRSCRGAADQVAWGCEVQSPRPVWARPRGAEGSSGAADLELVLLRAQWATGGCRSQETMPRAPLPLCPRTRGGREATPFSGARHRAEGTRVTRRCPRGPSLRPRPGAALSGAERGLCGHSVHPWSRSVCSEGRRLVRRHSRAIRSLKRYHRGGTGARGGDVCPGIQERSKVRRSRTRPGPAGVPPPRPPPQVSMRCVVGLVMPPAASPRAPSAPWTLARAPRVSNTRGVRQAPGLGDAACLLFSFPAGAAE